MTQSDMGWAGKRAGGGEVGWGDGNMNLEIGLGSMHGGVYIATGREVSNLGGRL